MENIKLIIKHLPYIATKHLKERFKDARGTGCFWDNFIWSPIRQMKYHGKYFYED